MQANHVVDQGQDHAVKAAMNTHVLERARIMGFGVFEADLRSGELRKSGFKIKLQDKPFEMLAALLEQPGGLVTREALRKRLWPADTFVDFDGSLNTAAGKLREALGDSAGNPRFIETMPRRGYRFIAPVEARENAASMSARSAVTRRFLPSNGVPPETSFAVLPFENFSSEHGQESFCDGMTEELITALGQVKGWLVVARTSSFAFKKLHRDVREIGESLGVANVVEGTVRKAGERLRITAQLTNVVTGYHLWSQRYDRNLKDTFAVQEEISTAVVQALKTRLDRSV